MSRNVAVPLLKTPVLLHELQIVTPHNNCALHLCAQDQTLQNPTTDADVTSERTLLVDIASLKKQFLA